MKMLPFESLAVGTSVLTILANMLSGCLVRVRLEVVNMVPPTLTETILFDIIDLKNSFVSNALLICQLEEQEKEE